MATGELCEALLVSHQYSTIVAQYEMTIAADILSTAPADKAKREELYASLWGARGLLEYMKLNASAAASIRDNANSPTDSTIDPVEVATDDYDDQRADDEFYS